MSVPVPPLRQNNVGRCRMTMGKALGYRGPFFISSIKIEKCVDMAGV